jgi:osmotically-inducible protein OsmY
MRNQNNIPAIALAIGLALLLLPAAALGQSRGVESIHQAIREAEVHVDSLKVIPVEGIVIVRGSVHDQESYRRVAMVLKSLGYPRVANLLRITPLPDDEAIERAAERELLTTRAMDGARVSVNSRNGVVTINGRVQHELQRDAAINIVRGVDGVRQVHSNLLKM